MSCGVYKIMSPDWENPSFRPNKKCIKIKVIKWNKFVFVGLHENNFTPVIEILKETKSYNSGNFL